MTAAQQLRLEGFTASLEQRGVLLLAHDRQFNALVQDIQPKAEEYTVSEETRDFSIVHILRSELDATTINVGDSFQVVGSNTLYRVTRVENNPTNIVVKFHCETASAP